MFEKIMKLENLSFQTCGECVNLANLIPTPEERQGGIWPKVILGLTGETREC